MLNAKEKDDMENENIVTSENTVQEFKTQEVKENKENKENIALNAEIERLKNALSKANESAADWKRQFREKQTEQERIEAERAEREKAVEEELRTLRRDKTVSSYMAKYISLGYSNELATRASEAMADGNATEVLACQSEFLENMKKELEAAALNKQPGLTSGSPPTAKQAEQDAMNKERAWFGLPPLK